MCYSRKDNFKIKETQGFSAKVYEVWKRGLIRDSYIATYDTYEEADRRMMYAR